MEIGMGTYRIDEIDLFTSIKYLGWFWMLIVLGYQHHIILSPGHQQHDSDDANDPYYLPCLT